MKPTKADKERMLPSDYTRFLKIDNLEKRLQAAPGFFTRAETIKVATNIPQREFLVFYFDNHDDYLLVRKFFEKTGSKQRSHPELKSGKLARMVRRYVENLKQDL